jgi:Sulfotransferase domain
METVFIAGMARCGSMWTYNITRGLIKASGRTLIPEVALVDETALLTELSMFEPPNIDFCCIKTHHCITPLNNSRLKIICNYRDIRDAILSFMRFTHCTHEQAIEAATAMMQVTDHYFQLGGQENLLKLRYEDLTEDYNAAAQSINQFLCLDVPEQAVKRLVQEFSKDSVRKRLKLLSVDRFQALMKYLGKRTSFYELVENYDGSSRIFHQATGFQTNHITDTQVGEWLEVFTTEEQKRLIGLTSSWLERYQYSAIAEPAEPAESPTSNIGAHLGLTAFA